VFESGGGRGTQRQGPRKNPRKRRRASIKKKKDRVVPENASEEFGKKLTKTTIRKRREMGKKSVITNKESWGRNSVVFCFIIGERAG